MTATRPRIQSRRPGLLRLLAGQTGYALLGLWRSRMVLIFTFAMPLVWLVIIGIVAGNETVDPVSGVRVMQFVTPVAISMGTFFGTFPTLATALSEARDGGVLKRIRGTPLPAWAYLAGQITAAVLFALASLVVTLTVAVLAYDVEIIARTALATAVTVIVGITAFAALGLAVAAVSLTTALAQAIATGSAIILSFISGLFVIGGELPGWLSSLASVFPLKPYNEALKHQFDPFQTGAGWDLGALAILAAWAAAATVTAAVAFRWQPRAARAAASGGGAAAVGSEAAASGGAAGAASGAVADTAPVARTVARPSVARLVLGQAVAANRATWRDPGSLLFVVIPVGLYALLLAIQGNVTLPNGLPFATFHAASMVAWGAGTALFMNLPDAVARARDRGVLKRLRGTPLPAAHYVAGNTVMGFGLTLFVALLVLVTGWLFFELRIPAAGLLVGLLVLLVGVLSLAAGGFLLAALVRNSRAVAAVGLAVLFVLSFFSDVFLVGGPEWMGNVGALFPLKHLQNGLADAWDPSGPVIAWENLAVMAGWAVGAGALSVRFFRWEPRRS
jgi:ABC-type multidrug transport system permease subunit